VTAVGAVDELRERLRRFVAPLGTERALDAGGGIAAALEPLVREVVVVEHGVVTRFPEELADFDLSCSVLVLHYVVRPELAVAELTRVTRPGGTILVVDQIAPVDPLTALELNRFERARDPSHVRTLADVDLRGLFEANGLVLRRAEFVREPSGIEVGWYLLTKPSFA
jgi:SAM-dependent methyltransferase